MHTDYAELQVTSNFSFLRGASHPDELFQQAFALGYRQLALTDRNTLAGMVRAHVVAKENGMRLIVGCRLDLEDGPSLLAYPTDRAAYGRLSQLLTCGKRRAPKGECHLRRADVYAYAAGLRLLAPMPELLDKTFAGNMAEYADVFGDAFALAASRHYGAQDAERLAWLAALARRLNRPLVATNDVHYHLPERRPLQDVLTCIREKCTIFAAGTRLFPNAERYLKTPAAMTRLFRDYPDAVRHSIDFIAPCRFSLDELRYEYPDEITSPGCTPQEELVRLAWEGAARRFPAGIPDKIRRSVEKELAFINEVNYAPYFLTVYDAVRFAREKDILCQGRGSAANSVVCYCLGITSVDPTEIDLLFERFLSAARNEPPDIDVDFEHERREEVMQYIFNKYGRERAGIVATVVQYRQKGALCDVGKAMGLSKDTVDRLSGAFWSSWSRETLDENRICEQGLDPTDRHLRLTVELAHELLGFPRHLSQHTGGFVITRGSLAELCPIMNAAMEDRTCIEWNKDDIDALGMLKVDVLALGMLTCVKKAFGLLQQHYQQAHNLASIPQNDAATYAMIQRADTVGVFQIESRAQMSMLPRLKPAKFYDLVIEVAIVRPGPIQGDMVHPYLRRRAGLEKPDYVKPELEAILSKTLGVPLFQEQAMNVAIVAAGFAPAEADRLRRAMATFKHVGTVTDFETRLVDGMVKNGYPREFAERCYKQLEGFGSYGFPESHAASFALLVYVSSWIKCHYPDVFSCALLNSLPMGFYAPAQLVRDARDHAVMVRPIDVNHSAWDCTLEEREGRYRALRLGFRLAKGLNEADAQLIHVNRRNGYVHVADLRRLGISYRSLEALAHADAFRSMGLDRRQALWEVLALHEKPAPLLATEDREAIFEPAATLPCMLEGEQVLQDYGATGLSLKHHPVSFLRGRLKAIRAVRTSELTSLPHGSLVKTAGLVLMRQRPGTASGVVFVTVEDETGIANLVVFNRIFERYRKALLPAKLLMAEGKLERAGSVTHLIVQRLYDFSPWLRDLTLADAEPTLPLGELHLTKPEGAFIPEARNFR